jgi:hypothetical protein
MRAERQLRVSLKEIYDLKAALEEHAIVPITDITDQKQTEETPSCQFHAAPVRRFKRVAFWPALPGHSIIRGRLL